MPARKLRGGWTDMNWVQELFDTYDRCANLPQFRTDPLPPIGHTTQQAHIEIVIDGRGNFRRASPVPRDHNTTLVPCTEASGGRSGTTPTHHPLCDKLQYIAADFAALGGEVTIGFAKDPAKPHRDYVGAMSAWAGSEFRHPKVEAILAYIQRGRVATDLVESGILPVDSTGKILRHWDGAKKSGPPIFGLIADPTTAFIRWSVEIDGALGPETWTDKALQESWISHYASSQTKRGFCMVTGKETVLTEQHGAKLRNAADKAKLISSNDSAGYTFRGRFLDAEEACGVGFEASQKAHAALRWLIRRQAHRVGDQVVVVWSKSGKAVPDPFANTFELFQGAEPEPAVRESLDVGDAGQAFALRCNRLMAGYRANLGSTEGIVVMAIDSASPGRMALAFYRTLQAAEFLDRVLDWHESNGWPQNYGPFQFVGAPAPAEIVEAAHGPAREQKRTLHKSTLERLLPCIFDGQRLPRDLLDAVVRRTVNRVGFERGKGGNEWPWEKNLGIACALVRGSAKQKGYQMALESQRTSRDYLYGRLLAIAEHLESRALFVAGEGRDTTAAKMFQRFADHPFSTWRLIEPALAPYKSRLRNKRPSFLATVEGLLSDVVASFPAGTFEDDRRLTGEFLLGYHCQRTALRPASSSPGEVEPASSH